MRWLVGLCLALVLAKPASACGFWSLVDTEKKIEVGWLINAGTVTRGDTRLANLYLDLDAKDGVRVAADHKVVFDVKRGKILRYGQAIGTVDGNTVTIGKHTYELAFSDQKSTHGLHDVVILSWKLEVKRGDDVILTSGEASSLCAALHSKQPMTDAEQQDEVRRRVVFYLAWRERGM
jgi:hypothetical protein